VGVSENGERRTENGERRTENGERRTENGELLRHWHGIEDGEASHGGHGGNGGLERISGGTYRPVGERTSTNKAFLSEN
jgi:hypothetical protein